MSFDILVFDPAAVSDAGFAQWWDAQSAWPEEHSYTDDAVTTPALRAFFHERAAEFPPMNGPCAADDVDDPRATDYAIGTRLVYACFGWSQQQEAQDVVLRLAASHHVAVALVSSSHEEIIRP